MSTPDPYGYHPSAWRLAVGLTLAMAGAWLLIQVLLEAGVVR